MTEEVEGDLVGAAEVGGRTECARPLDEDSSPASAGGLQDGIRGQVPSKHHALHLATRLEKGPTRLVLLASTVGVRSRGANPRACVVERVSPDPGAARCPAWRYARAVRGLLVRVGIDQAYGGWNAPVDPETHEFAYVPIPDSAQHAELATPYSQVEEAVARFAGVKLPKSVRAEAMHLDPDFSHLTYGDVGTRRGRGASRLAKGDFIAFYSSMRPTRPADHTLIYALIGFYRVHEVAWVEGIPRERWGENAHTRRLDASPTDIVVRAQPGVSGRLRRCIPVGEYRDRSYRVRRDLLRAWGPLSCRDGFLQRSAVPPSFVFPERFLSWLDDQHPEFVATNNP